MILVYDINMKAKSMFTPDFGIIRTLRFEGSTRTIGLTRSLDFDGRFVQKMGDETNFVCLFSTNNSD